MTTQQDNNGRQPTIRTTPMPSDINHNGHVFGGWILSQMDLAGGIVAIRRAGGQVATVAVNAMTFFTPVLVSDWISIYADIIKTGRTSITVHIEVRVMRRDETREIRVTEGTFTYVRIDDKARPKSLPQ